jgi:hypothetical protein
MTTMAYRPPLIAAHALAAPPAPRPAPNTTDDYERL